MVTAYCIMKLAQKSRGVDIVDYYSNLHKNGLKKPVCKNFTCRVCLRQASLSIYSVENSAEIVNALLVFGNIDINEDGDYPKHLCNKCHKFITGAILFRKIAKQSDEILKQCVKNEPFEDFQDSHISEDIEIEISDQIPINRKIKTAPKQHSEKEKAKNAKVQCYVCNKIVTSSYFKEHITMHDPNHHKYICDICGKSFRLRCAYHNHSLRHRTDFPYKCQFCPYKARYTELLKTHMRTHTGDYRYMCTECPARFLFKSNLNRHVLIKHRAPQHECGECKRVFHTKIMLQRHHEVHHLGIKNHVCNLCGKAFGYRNAMMKHQRHVHKREKLAFCRKPSYLQYENKDIITDSTYFNINQSLL